MQELRRRNRSAIIASAVNESLEAGKDFDFYPTLNDDHKKTEKTVTGAAGTCRVVLAKVAAGAVVGVLRGLAAI